MATGAVRSVFVDTNVLVYATVDDAPFHACAQAAITELKQQHAQMWISRQVIREYLAVLGRQPVSSRVHSVSDHAAQARALEESYIVADENAAVTQQLLALVSERHVAGKRVHDANIVATMLSYGITHLLTHNTSDFDQYRDLITVLPLLQGNPPVAAANGSEANAKHK